MKNEIVLSGPITGHAGYKDQFAGAAKFVWQNHPNATVFNPATLPPGNTESWYMARCLDAIFECETIVMLPGWEHSAGARCEHSLAVKLCKKITYWSGL